MGVQTHVRKSSNEVNNKMIKLFVGFWFFVVGGFVILMGAAAPFAAIYLAYTFLKMVTS